MSLYDTGTFKVLDAIYDERIRQDAKWGKQREIKNAIPGYAYAINGADYYKSIEQRRAKDHQSTWIDIILEEVAEAIDEAKAGDTAALRKELVQVAAVAVNWVENLDRQGTL